MNRNEQAERLKQQEPYDIVIIGGGATGLGCAVDAASRGYKTLLLEKYDFSKGTSSRSTKLVHGGVRYLAQGNIRLVREALLERGRLLKNAPHVCHTISFIVPSYRWWQKWFYGTGLWIYEFLSGKLSLGKTRLLSKSNILLHLPDLSQKNLNGGILYFDGQFDDSRLAVNLAQTAIGLGATVVNYCGVSGFVMDGSKIRGVRAKDQLNGKEYLINAKVVINATGVFADAMLQQAEGHKEETIVPSQGIHMIVENNHFSGDAGMMIPKTDDGRVMFIIPWNGKLLLGTTDTPVDTIAMEPIALKEEMDFIIAHFNRYTSSEIGYRDIKSVFVGLRPLAKTGDKKRTSVMPRDHVIKVLPSGLVHVTGGKWTTYRSMAENAIDRASRAAGLTLSKCTTRDLKIYGWTDKIINSHLSVYGSAAHSIIRLLSDDHSLTEKIHPDYPCTRAEVKWIIENEMAVTVEDILARRTRLLFIDAMAAIDAAPAVASMLASATGKGAEWEREQIKEFITLAASYLPAY